ncbi:MAG: ribosome-associated translation inhibitor RaiA [Deltaproteobacteria bacterium]|nr:ribosome-associated translation inhibitor RaiA [Deltaproteobacteria bacterium]
MHTTVTFRHLESSDAIRDYATEKAERAAKYLIEPIEVHWALSVEKFRHIASITIAANGITIKGEEQTQDMYSAVDLVMNKIEKQMRKFKEKLKDHKPGAAAAKRAQKEFQPKVIRAGRSSIKPMSLEEAVSQIDALKNNFLVFADTHTDNINVLYKRKDGNYGLIETAGR